MCDGHGWIVVNYFIVYLPENVCSVLTSITVCEWSVDMIQVEMMM